MPQATGMALSCRFLATSQQDGYILRDSLFFQMSRNHPISATSLPAGVVGPDSGIWFHCAVKKKKISYERCLCRFLIEYQDAVFMVVYLARFLSQVAGEGAAQFLITSQKERQRALNFTKGTKLIYSTALRTMEFHESVEKDN